MRWWPGRVPALSSFMTTLHVRAATASLIQDPCQRATGKWDRDEQPQVSQGFATNKQDGANSPGRVHPNAGVTSVAFPAARA